MGTPPRSRLRLFVLWIVFAVGAAAAAVAVQRLHARAQREVAEQAERAAHAALQRAQQRAIEESEALRFGTIRSLAGMHVDGLAAVLRRWDESNPHITGVFLWEPERGFVVAPPEAMSDSSLAPPPLSRDQLMALWTEFRRRRPAHPAESGPHAMEVGGFAMTLTPTLANDALAAGGLGYQDENLDILRHAGRSVDPWAGCVVKHGEPRAPWVFWYQPGPEAPVRGCFVEVGNRLARLRAEWKETDLVRLELEANAPLAARPGAVVVPLADFPGFTWVARPGEVFERKRTDVWWNAAAVALLLALFLLGGSALAWHTRRVSREAERQLTFVAQVSHELRTPLTSIRMFADLLGAPEIATEKRTKFAGTISRESARLGGLIERLLTFNALERGARPANCTHFEVGALARETVDELQGALQAAGLSARLELPAEPMLVRAEASAVKQALVNLFDNAMKYAGAGHGGTEVRISGATDARGVTLRVADDGPGVPAEIRSRVFDPFVQGDRSMTDKTPGIGLGLSIARGLLRQGGGELVLLPTARGAAFELRLPRATSSSSPDSPPNRKP